MIDDPHTEASLMISRLVRVVEQGVRSRQEGLDFPRGTPQAVLCVRMQGRWNEVPCDTLRGAQDMADFFNFNQIPAYVKPLVNYSPNTVRNNLDRLTA